MASASVLVTWTGTPLVLGISRDTNAVVVDLPGGHLERGESYEQAASRELAEETAIVIPPQHLEVLHHGGEHVVFRPRADYAYVIPPQLQSVPFEGVPGWYLPADLLRLTWYPEHAGAAFRAAGLL